MKNISRNLTPRVKIIQKIYSKILNPDEEIIFVFLSNRTFPTRENTLLQTSNIRTRSQEIIYKSIIDSE